MFERLTVNGVGKVRREWRGGREYLVAPLTSIVPGVLNGSKGALYYPPEEIQANPSQWDGIPITVYHPTDPLTGAPLSARDAGVMDRQAVGYLRNSRIGTGDRLQHEAWFDAERTRKVDVRVYDGLVKNRPLEQSTGLYTRNEPMQGHDPRTGRSYDYVARDYRPDHLAVLPDQVGACSLRDGCGVLVNGRTGWVTLDNGVHVYLVDGVITKGPGSLVQSKPDEDANKKDSVSGWRASMTKEDADAWSKDSVLKETVYHGTGVNERGHRKSASELEAILSSIKSSGFRVTSAERTASGGTKLGGAVQSGRQLGDGVYLSPDANTAGRYGTVLPIKVNVKKMWEGDWGTWSQQYSKITREMKKDGVKLNPTERINAWAKKHGYEALKVQDQLVVFNPKHVTVVDPNGGATKNQQVGSGGDRDDSGWVTLPSGTHIQLKGGEVVKGPKVGGGQAGKKSGKLAHGKAAQQAAEDSANAMKESIKYQKAGNQRMADFHKERAIAHKKLSDHHADKAGIDKIPVRVAHSSQGGGIFGKIKKWLTGNGELAAEDTGFVVNLLAYNTLASQEEQMTKQQALERRNVILEKLVTDYQELVVANAQMRHHESGQYRQNTPGTDTSEVNAAANDGYDDRGGGGGLGGRRNAPDDDGRDTARVDEQGTEGTAGAGDDDGEPRQLPPSEVPAKKKAGAAVAVTANAGQHFATQQAASASLEHGPARKPALKALDASGDGNHDKAAAAHLEAAGIHEQAATEARKGGKDDAARSHDQAAGQHRTAASMHQAVYTPTPKEQGQATTTNEETMTRTQAIKTLTANCGCRGGDAAALNAMSDALLVRLAQNAKAEGSNADVTGGGTLQAGGEEKSKDKKEDPDLDTGTEVGDSKVKVDKTVPTDNRETVEQYFERTQAPTAVRNAVYRGIEADRILKGQLVRQLTTNADMAKKLMGLSLPQLQERLALAREFAVTNGLSRNGMGGGCRNEGDGDEDEDDEEGGGDTRNSLSFLGQGGGGTGVTANRDDDLLDTPTLNQLLPECEHLSPVLRKRLVQNQTA